MALARADAQGIARIEQELPRRETLPDCLGGYHKVYLVTARAGDDLSFAFSDWNEGITPWYLLPGAVSPLIFRWHPLLCTTGRIINSNKGLLKKSGEAIIRIGC